MTLPAVRLNYSFQREVVTTSSIHDHYRLTGLSGTKLNIGLGWTIIAQPMLIYCRLQIWIHGFPLSAELDMDMYAHRLLCACESIEGAEHPAVGVFYRCDEREV